MSLRKRKNSLRLSGYDYSQSGAYFVTILAHQRLHLFGSIEHSVVSLSKLGDIVESCWLQIPQHYASVKLDAYVIMPNHIHGIVFIYDDTKATLSQIMNTFKGAVTRIAKQSELDIDLEHPVWHRSFHDRIIRNEQEFKHLARYIHANPARWDKDDYNTC